jgi:hypothetical protein
MEKEGSGRGRFVQKSEDKVTKGEREEEVCLRRVKYVLIFL